MSVQYEVSTKPRLLLLDPHPLSTEKQNYDMIYFGSSSDADKETKAVRGVENAAGGYTYTFEVPASKETQTVSVVPHSKKSPLGNREGEAVLNEVRRTALAWNCGSAVHRTLFS